MFYPLEKKRQKNLVRLRVKKKTTPSTGTSTEATSTQLEAMTVQNSHAPSPPGVKFVKEPSNGSDKSSFVKKVKMLIDSGASCNVLPIKYAIPPQRNCG